MAKDSALLIAMKDFRVEQIPEAFAEYNYLIATMIIENDEPALRIRTRNDGWQDVERALEWNKKVR